MLTAYSLQQAEAEELPAKHAQELQHLEASREEAVQALSCAQDEHVAAQMRLRQQVFQLRQQHEELAHTLQAHTQEMQVGLAQADIYKLNICFNWPSEC